MKSVCVCVSVCSEVRRKRNCMIIVSVPVAVLFYDLPASLPTPMVCSSLFSFTFFPLDMLPFPGTSPLSFPSDVPLPISTAFPGWGHLTKALCWRNSWLECRQLQGLLDRHRKVRERSCFCYLNCDNKFIDSLYLPWSFLYIYTFDEFYQFTPSLRDVKYFCGKKQWSLLAS